MVGRLVTQLVDHLFFNLSLKSQFAAEVHLFGTVNGLLNWTYLRSSISVVYQKLMTPFSQSELNIHQDHGIKKKNVQ